MKPATIFSFIDQKNINKTLFTDYGYFICFYVDKWG